MKREMPPLGAGKSGRRTAGRAQLDEIADPYQVSQKPREPTVCDACGAVYLRGRWQWGSRPDDADKDRCPACRRIHDGAPAGIVTLHGPFAAARLDEIVSLARHQEEIEKRDHPLNRIIGIERAGDHLVITTTDVHLPRRLGMALKRALHGELRMDFDDDGYFVRVDWHAPKPAARRL